MNGIEKITARIQQDAQAEIDELLATARTQADEILAEAKLRAEAAKEGILAKGRVMVEERQSRLASVTQLECRKANLAAKQAVLQEAFQLAVKKLCTLPEDEYIALLSDLAVEASSTGREKLIFSQADRARVGKAVVMMANEKLARASAPLNGTAMLTLAEETRPLQGGFILSDGTVEVNCGFDTLVWLQRDALAGEVAKVLFE